MPVTSNEVLLTRWFNILVSDYFPSLKFKKLKKAGYILLTFIFLMQTGGLLMLYHLQKCWIQFETQEAIREGSLELEALSLSFNEFQKAKIDDGEMLLNGKMYDIKSVTIEGEAVTLLAFNDTKEENVLEKIKQYINRKLPNDEVPLQLVKFFSLVFLTPVHNHIVLFDQLNNHNFTYYSAIITSRSVDTFSPPPEIA